MNFSSTSKRKWSKAAPKNIRPFSSSEVNDLLAKASVKEVATIAGLVEKKAQLKYVDRGHEARFFKANDEGFIAKANELEHLAPTLPEPLNLDIVAFHYMLSPNLKLTDWQATELKRFAGQFANGQFNYTAEIPYLMNLRAANGSGKDEIIICRSLLWKALTGFKNRGIVTTASERQLLTQTIPHLTRGANRCNEIFGDGTFRTTQKHYYCLKTGSEILAFVTDEPKRAEGFHPWSRDDGNPAHMCIIVNEAKTPADDIFDALDRCTGYTHQLRISSPDRKAGRFYRDSISSINYPEQNPPAPFVPGKWYAKKVTAWECHYIPRSHIERQIAAHVNDPGWILSSIEAEFADIDLEHIVIPSTLWEARIDEPPPLIESGIGIGGDWAAGNDENSVFVRKGNKVIFEFHFTEKNTERAVDIIDSKLHRFKNLPYIFNADDGGIGHALNDMLHNRGWKIRRRHNQSPPVFNSTEYLNFGAESYHHVRDLLTHNLIIPHVSKTSILSEQLCHRRAKPSDRGKLKLIKKSEERNDLGYSPDRADAFVLCFWSYRPKTRFKQETGEQSGRKSIEELIDELSWGVTTPNLPKDNGRPTFIRTNI